MKRILKNICITLFLIVIIYALFIFEESIRLSHNKLAEPLIVFKEIYSGNVGNVEYISLGFTLTTKYTNYFGSNDIVYPISQEFWLFDKFLIWSWIG